jgi:hypothetical protein
LIGNVCTAWVLNGYLNAFSLVEVILSKDVEITCLIGGNLLNIVSTREPNLGGCDARLLNSNAKSTITTIRTI